MSTLYRYVGPDDIRAQRGAIGTPIQDRADLIAWVSRQPERPPVDATFVIDPAGVLRVAPRRSEHVACAGGGEVRAAGELTADAIGVVIELSNQSTGYCPEPSCLDAVTAALDTARIPHPGRFTASFLFRRCESCGQRTIVKDDWFECAVCGAELPREWNF